MRRLLLLVCALVWVDTLLYSALTPLLPHFVHDLHLSKAGAGVLVAAYAAGALVGGLPGGAAAARLGARRAVLVGLTLMGLASLGFAFAHGFWPLAGARFLQGVGSGFTWAGAFAWLLAAAPGERRGELIGTAMGAAVFGALLGPVVGAAAALLGRDVVFTALAGLAVVLAVWTLRLESVPPEAPSLAAMQRALRESRFVGGLVLMALPSFLYRCGRPSDHPGTKDSFLRRIRWLRALGIVGRGHQRGRLALARRRQDQLLRQDTRATGVGWGGRRHYRWRAGCASGWGRSQRRRGERRR